MVEVDGASSSEDTSASWFEPRSITLKKTSDILEERGWVNQKISKKIGPYLKSGKQIPLHRHQNTM